MAAAVGQGARHGLVFGFAGYSGSGKTSLIEQVIPRLVAAGRMVSVIKHAHHRFDFDTPGKDSWRHRQAGATEVLLTTDQRWVLMHELRGQPEPGLEAQLARMSPSDVVLIEGFKTAAIPKIEVHRPALGKPLLHRDDPWIQAIATDAPLDVPLPLLDLNDPDAVTAFILARCGGAFSPVSSFRSIPSQAPAAASDVAARIGPAAAIPGSLPSAAPDAP